MSLMTTFKAQARQLKTHTLTVYFAARDPRTPWPVRLLALTVAAYAFSPIDLIPDFIPVLGYVDDLLLVPLGLYLVIRWTPQTVLEDARDRARASSERPTSRGAAVAVVMIWLLALAGVALWLYPWTGPANAH